MITIGQGRLLGELFDRIESRSRRGNHLYVITPFIDVESHGWRATLAAAQAGSLVCLVTRSPASLELTNAFAALRAVGGRIVVVDNLHAKGLLWFGDSGRDRVAFVGSNNLTMASEHSSVELGLFAQGDGRVENHVYRDVKTFIEELTNPRALSGSRRKSSGLALRTNTNRRNFQRRTKWH
jgi:phosphatidylserine/phosphatidylglycerophosphate/cardiolipin synthase-like enzyme